MTARAQMKNRINVERDAGGDKDSWNQKPPATWEPHLNDYPGLAWSKAKSEREGGSVNEKVAVIEDLRVNVALGTDVTSSDRLTSITDRKGNVLFPGPFYIDTVQARRTHLELLLRKSAAT